MRFKWLLGLAIWIVVLSFNWGPVPALGPLLDLSRGVWQHTEWQWRDRKIPGLQKPVTVAIDGYGVPHLFAENAADLYLAQGFVTASQRLFQMDVSSRSATGGLSEIAGERALELDRYFVKFGIRETARESERVMMNEPLTREMVTSYVTGANAYLRQMGKALPAEYKFLGTKPKPFEPIRSINMARALTYSLNGRSYDLQQTLLLKKLGAPAVLDLYPEFLPSEYEEYVIPENLAPGGREADPALQLYNTSLHDLPATFKPERGNGSNNWAVAPKKSATGHSILANDTHLEQTLPNTWFENQLSCPDFNVYGVSLPMIPGIINGFNPWIAWGPTNGTTDGLDWYEVRFESADSNNYHFNGRWIPAEVREELIAVKGRPAVKVEVVQTKFGAILYRDEELGLAAKWVGSQIGNELLAVRNHYGAKSLHECVDTFKPWSSPIQNFACADQDHIALVHAGFIPKRKPGEGRVVLDSSVESNRLEVPLEEKFRPVLIDPPEGYVNSSNQRVEGPKYPYYLGWDFEEPFRGRRVREVLAAKEKLTGENLIQLQADDVDLQAKYALPLMLGFVQREKLEPEQKAELALLEKWNFSAKHNSSEAAVYKTWWRFLKRQVFSDEMPAEATKPFYPKDMRLIWLLARLKKDVNDPDAKWVDNRNTTNKETVQEVVTSAFTDAWTEVSQKLGPDPSQWKWSALVKTHFPHLGRIPGFGSETLLMNGTGETVNANRGTHGAVFKMVVELGAWPKAWMSVPGGPSGDPFSLKYGEGLQEWADGKMKLVEFYRDVNEAKAKAKQVVVYSPEGA